MFINVIRSDELKINKKLEETMLIYRIIVLIFIWGIYFINLTITPVYIAATDVE